ncbi:MAG: hypothetical protein HOP19_12560, partial [Acidobacteria bacterium]|nr:hypothetical protein [Acidobacteriota bacterium]
TKTGAATGELVNPASAAPAVKPAAVTSDEAKQKASVTAEPAEAAPPEVKPEAKPDATPIDRSTAPGESVAEKTLPLFSFSALQWTLTPPPEIKSAFGRALMADLNFALPTAPVIKPAADSAIKQ